MLDACPMCAVGVNESTPHTATCINTGIPLVVLEWPELQGFSNYKKPKIDYIRKCFSMTEEELFEETEQKIWLSAYASNNAKSDYHWQRVVTAFACERFDGLYNRAFIAASEGVE